VVGGALQDDAGHASLGGGELGPGGLLGGCLAAVAGGGELALGAFGPDLGPKGVKRRRGARELLSRVGAPARTAQALAVAELGAGPGEGQRRAIVPLQRALEVLIELGGAGQQPSAPRGHGM